MDKVRELHEVWQQQSDYNTLVRDQERKSAPEWMINYILGAMSELTELLDETNWRTHRIKRLDQFGPNVKEELVDVTKYVFSMWQLLGYDPYDMLDAMYEKGDILQQLMMQELRPSLNGKNILMLDLDGVVADFRSGFLHWISNNHWKDILTIREEQLGLHMDINNGWDFQAYNQAKIEFEQDGGYSRLPVMDDIKQAIGNLYRAGWHVIVYTARPYSIYKRIWGDTWKWLKENEVLVNELHFGYDVRVVVASALSNTNFVVALEDDPTLIKRYTGCQIPVFICPQPYNQGISLDETYAHFIDSKQPSWKISHSIDTLSRKKE